MIDADAPEVAPYCGSYRIGSGHVIFVGGFLGSTVLTLHDFKSRRIGTLSRGRNAESSFSAGPTLWKHVPPEITLAFERGDDGKATRLTYCRADNSLEYGERVELTQQEVRFTSEDVTLAGTLFLPDGRGPHPAVVLIHGSGPQTRACVRLHAEYFARHGVAALAYDKRGAGQSSPGPDDFRLLARDALSGVRLLREQPQIDPSRVGLCGSSQGGWIAPLAAQDAPDEVAFAILVAGPAVSIAEQNRQNVEYTMRAAGFPEEQVQAGARQARSFNELMRTGEGWDEFRALVRQAEVEGWIKHALAAEMRERPPKPANPRRGMDASPTLVLARLKRPVLALFGDGDTVVPPAENAPLMEAALRQSGHPQHEVVVVPGASHLFHEVDGSGRSSAVRFFLPQYLDLMVRWVLGLFPAANTRAGRTTP